MKELIWNRTIKVWLWGALVGLLIGNTIGSRLEMGRVYADCRYTGVVRIGEAAFKCEQFSKVVLLTPDEVAKKEVKK